MLYYITSLERKKTLKKRSVNVSLSDSVTLTFSSVGIISSTHEAFLFLYHTLRLRRHFSNFWCGEFVRRFKKHFGFISLLLHLVQMSHLTCYHHNTTNIWRCVHFFTVWEMFSVWSDLHHRFVILRSTRGHQIKKNKNEMISYIFGIVNQGPNPLTSYPNSTPNHIIISNCYIGCVINNWATPPFWSFLSFKF